MLSTSLVGSSPDGSVRAFWTRTVVQPGSLGLPATAEAGLPPGDLFELIPVPDNGTPELLLEIKVIAAGIEIVAESCESEAAELPEDSELPTNHDESAWDFHDHIATNERVLLRCTGHFRFRITAPAGLDATFNILRSGPVTQLPEPPFRSSNEMGGWGDMDTNSEAEDFDDGFADAGQNGQGILASTTDEPAPSKGSQLNVADAGSQDAVSAGVPAARSSSGNAMRPISAPGDAAQGTFSRFLDADSPKDNGLHPICQSGQTHPFYPGNNSNHPALLFGGGGQKTNTPNHPVVDPVNTWHGQHASPNMSHQKPNIPVAATPRINESQWRDMGFDSEEKARQTLGDDFFGVPAHVNSPHVPILGPPAQQNTQDLYSLANAAHNISSLEPGAPKKTVLAQAAAVTVAHSSMGGMIQNSQSCLNLKRITPEEPVLANGAEAVKNPRHDHEGVAQASTLAPGAVDVGGEQEECVESPFALMWIRYNMPKPYNHGAFGVKLRQVVKGAIRMAVVSNFMIDAKWLVTACPDLRNAAQIVLLHGDSQSGLACQMQEVGVPATCKVQNHSPPLPIPYGTHHSKFFLLFYVHGVRVVIHTANLIFCDCNNKTQGLFFQDFPFHSGGSGPTGEADTARLNTAAVGMAAVTDHSVQTDFYNELIAYMRALRMPANAFTDIERQLNRCDFSSARVALVPSIPGRHDRSVYNRFGHMRLRSVLSKHTFRAHFSGAPVCCQFSSMGSLTQDWLQGEFLVSLSAGKVRGAAGGSGNNHPIATGNTLAPPKVQDLSLVWPTSDQVCRSLEGWAAGASIPGYSHNVSKPFLKPVMTRWGGVFGPRERAMPHIKTFCRFRGNEIAWACLSSHNLSRAAWGELQKKRSVLFIRSYELGVVFLPALEAHFRQHKHRSFSCTDPVDPSTNAAAASTSSAAHAQSSATCNSMLRCPWSAIPAVPGVIPCNRLRNTSSSAVPSRGERTKPPQHSGDASLGTSCCNTAEFTEGVSLVDKPPVCDEGAEVVFVAAGQPPGADGEAAAANVARGEAGEARHVVVPLLIPFVLPPVRYGIGDVLWKVDVDSSAGVVDSIGLERSDAGGTMYGYSQQSVQPYFDANN